MSLLFNMLSRLALPFLPRSKCLLISWLQSQSAVILEPTKIKSVTVSIVSPSICHEVMGPDAIILVFFECWVLSQLVHLLVNKKEQLGSTERDKELIPDSPTQFITKGKYYYWGIFFMVNWGIFFMVFTHTHTHTHTQTHTHSHMSDLQHACSGELENNSPIL